MAQAEIILHHYDTSPFSEKVRLMLGLKKLAWRSVIQPTIMPKPDLVPLTGGYRRIPVMQVGADVYLDSQVILAELNRRSPRPAARRGLDMAVNLWADRLFFQASVPIIFGALGGAVDKAFIEDREKLSGRPFDTDAMLAAGEVMRGQWRAQAVWIDEALADRDFLDGPEPGLSDLSAYMNIWFLGSFLAPAADELLAGLTRLQAWRGRVAAIGHGRRTEMTPAEALEAARTATPAPCPEAHDATDPAGLQPGQAVTVSADDYGRDPIAGTLVAAGRTRIVIARDEPSLGALHLHFPRVGYVARAA